MRPIVKSIAFAAAVIAALAGCGGGGGKGKGGAELVQTVAQTRARYQILDLASGVATPTGTVPDLSDPAYRSTKMVFRQIEPASATLGSTGFAAEADEARRSVSLSRYYLAVFETTQAQWTAIGGSAVWTTLQSGNPSDIQVGGTYPAVGISADAAGATLGAYNAGRTSRLRLPSENEWEYACRAGTSSSFSWGDSIGSASVNRYARVWESATGRGAAPVGSLDPNGWGFYDMHGNAWELCAGGYPRGGSWNDPLTLARSANRMATTSGSVTIPAIESDTAHLLVGVRLVYAP